MKRVLYYSIAMLAAGCGALSAQTIEGKVTDEAMKPVEGVAVVLQRMDSVYVGAVVTDSLGSFRFDRASDLPYRLLFQHLLFKNAEREVQEEGDQGVIRLSPKAYALDEVTVRADRPQVKVEGSKLSYEIPAMATGRTETNAFEVVQHLPGITGTGDDLQLAGASRLHIVVNGKLTTMTLAQMQELLKSIPASRVQRVEIQYNAPAKYNLKGSLINVVLTEQSSDAPLWQGETAIGYEQRHYASGNARANLLYSGKRLSLDFLANGGYGRNFDGEDMLARHTLADGTTEIGQHGRRPGKAALGTVRLAADYAFGNGDKLSASYYIDGERNKKWGYSTTSYHRLANDSTWQRSNTTNIKLPETLHNVRLEYAGHGGWNAGVDFTRYVSHSDQYFFDRDEAGRLLTDQLSNSGQEATRWQLFANRSRSWEQGWSLSYGMNLGYARSDNALEYRYNRGNGYVIDPEQSETNVQKDYTANLFAEVSKSFGSKFSATVALKGEYFKSDYCSETERKTLWEDWTFYPTVSLNYLFSPSHILQLNVNSNKTFPTYLTLSPQATPVNSYSEVQGNPFLKPYRSYEGQLLYILRQKYMLMFFCNYEPDYFTQLPYQSAEEMKNIFRYENFDYGLKMGFNLIVPFRVGKAWDARLTLQGFRMQEKDSHFNGMAFDRQAYVGLAKLSNTFRLSTRPALSLTLDGTYVTPGAIQGIYDLGRLYDVSAGLKWSFLKERASLVLRADDVFRSTIPTAAITQGTQWSRLTKLNDERAVTLTFTWKFGGFKQGKEHEAVDRSRFGN